MLTIRPMTEADYPAVLQLTVADDQLSYVGTTKELLNRRQSDWHLHVVCAGEETIGVFNLDLGYASHMPFAGCGELGLRSFLIDQRQQGQGYGTQAVRLLPDYLQQNYPDCQRLWLTVNCQNPAAYHCYLKAGFDDSNEIYHGGLAGPQHIMSLTHKR
ncbi:GNAT family N-acetyltransferase [Bacterioplanes sanyensis]|uniref:GNAT family N-acetyltransferase n=1 Tax=Bacterioplanes sanyensis TaxID=1249553 RepID=A0A222FJ92_9GAMM|nr:GNAT family protein [Bacterioplanes sanyensis]ASP38491.1 GNAT family N-acetyltransferase [Bacterioplanes sanyensis]